MLKRLIAIVAVVSVLLGLIAYDHWRQTPAHVSGVVEADEIRLGSRLGGRVARVLVEEGERVTVGQVLVELEPYDLLERERELQQTLAARDAEMQRLTAGPRPEEIAQAEAKLNQLTADLDLLRAGPRKQELEAARERVKLANAELALARQNFDRESALYAERATSRQELDAAQEALTTTEINVSIRQQELAVLEAGSRAEEIRAAQARAEEAQQALQMLKNGYRAEEIAAATASRDAAAAAVAAIQRQQEELTIKSPIEATVESLDLRPGDIVAPGAPVVAILDRDNLWIRTYLPENRTNLRLGQQLPVTIDSLPQDRFTGTISFVSRQAEFTPSNVQTPEERSKQVFRVKLQIKDAGEKLRAGMTADVWLQPLEGES